MLDEGWVEKADADRYLKRVPAIRPRLSTGQLAGNKGHLIEAVRKELNALGFPDEQLMIGGLIVRTTLEKDAQVAAEAAVFNQAPKKAPDNLHIGLVSIRPGTGEIVAMYGGKDYLERQLNAATQGITQAGSTFKPFALIAALEQGIPLSSIWDAMAEISMMESVDHMKFQTMAINLLERSHFSKRVQVPSILFTFHLE